MICLGCGEDCPESWDRCFNCGTPLVYPERAAPGPAADAPPAIELARRPPKQQPPPRSYARVKPRKPPKPPTGTGPVMGLIKLFVFLAILGGLGFAGWRLNRIWSGAVKKARQAWEPKGLGARSSGNLGPAGTRVVLGCSLKDGPNASLVGQITNYTDRWLNRIQVDVGWMILKTKQTHGRRLRLGNVPPHGKLVVNRPLFKVPVLRLPIGVRPPNYARCWFWPIEFEWGAEPTN